jgi:hypothetical protein
MHAVPPPPPRGRARADKQLRQARGMLAGGVIFATICGAGAGLGIWVIADPRTRPGGGQDASDAVAAVSGLLSCTVGALALASAGGVKLKQRRSR